MATFESTLAVFDGLVQGMAKPTREKGSCQHPDWNPQSLLGNLQQVQERHLSRSSAQPVCRGRRLPFPQFLVGNGNRLPARPYVYLRHHLECTGNGAGKFVIVVPSVLSVRVVGVQVWNDERAFPKAL